MDEVSLQRWLDFRESRNAQQSFIVCYTNTGHKQSIWALTVHFVIRLEREREKRNQCLSEPIVESFAFHSCCVSKKKYIRQD